MILNTLPRMIFIYLLLQICLNFAAAKDASSMGKIQIIRPVQNTVMVATQRLYVEYRVSSPLKNTKVQLTLFRRSWRGKKVKIMEFEPLDSGVQKHYLDTIDMKTSFDYFLFAMLIDADGKEVPNSETQSPAFSIYSTVDAKRHGFPVNEPRPYQLFDSGASLSYSQGILTGLVAALSFSFYALV
jgi:hypothetical protein